MIPKILILLCILSFNSLGQATSHENTNLICYSPDYGRSLWLIGGYNPRIGWMGQDASIDQYQKGLTFYKTDLYGSDYLITTGDVDYEMGSWYALIPEHYRGDENTSGTYISNQVPLNTDDITICSPQNEVYKNLMTLEISSRGVELDQARLDQLIRVDLNGDGVDEMLITSHSQENFGGRIPGPTNDYSLFCVRYLTASGVNTDIISFNSCLRSESLHEPAKFVIESILDINGDGMMEFILSATSFETTWVRVYSFNGEKIECVVSTMWGV